MDRRRGRPPALTTAAVVLAAGGSSRFEAGQKLLAPFRGKPLVSWAVEHALEASLDETIVVVGGTTLPLPPDIRIVNNPRWAEGLASSVQAALAECALHEAVVVGLGDQPFVQASAWRAVAASASPIAVATYGGRRGNPVRLAREIWPLLPVSGDEGARNLIRSRADLVEGVACDGESADIDTVEDLSRWS